jgi:hypothetical protein
MPGWRIGRGLVSVGGGLAFDEMPFGLAFSATGKTGFLGAVASPLVLDAADGQPEQFDHRVVVGEVAAVLDDLAQLTTQTW